MAAGLAGQPPDCIEMPPASLVIHATAEYVLIADLKSDVIRTRCCTGAVVSLAHQDGSTEFARTLLPAICGNKVQRDSLIKDVVDQDDMLATHGHLGRAYPARNSTTGCVPITTDAADIDQKIAIEQARNPDQRYRATEQYTEQHTVTAFCCRLDRCRKPPIRGLHLCSGGDEASPCNRRNHQLSAMPGLARAWSRLATARCQSGDPRSPPPASGAFSRRRNATSRACPAGSE